VETLGADAGVHFDHDGNGAAELSGWAGKDDGLLVLDRNSNGKIDSGGELFGNNTRLSNGQTADNGFLALAELDGNRDGVIDAQDDAFAQLRVWQDANSNGRADNGELLTLEQAGVASLDVGYTNQNLTDEHGNRILQAGSYTGLDGAVHDMADVWFTANTADTEDWNAVTLPADIAALPEVTGDGNVPSLRQAMARDESGQLRALVEKFVDTTDAQAQAALLDQILFTWTGADQGRGFRNDRPGATASKFARPRPESRRGAARCGQRRHPPRLRARVPAKMPSRSRPRDISPRLGGRGTGQRPRCFELRDSCSRQDGIPSKTRRSQSPRGCHALENSAPAVSEGMACPRKLGARSLRGDAMPSKAAIPELFTPGLPSRTFRMSSRSARGSAIKNIDWLSI
jgi:hypothetical protein